MVSVPSDRERLKTTINSAAGLYHQARPAYPSELFDKLVRLAHLRPGDRAAGGCLRDRLYGEIRRRLATRPDGRLRRHWGAVLHVARRRNQGTPANL